MTLAWMVYSSAVALLLAAAAAALEGSRDHRGRSRAVWICALLGSLTLPLSGWRGVRIPLPGGAAGQGSESGGLPGAIPVLEPILVPIYGNAGGEAAAPWMGLEALVLAGWLVVSAALLLMIGGSYLHLLRESRSWRRGVVQGRDVLISPSTGPAVIGFVRPRIVLPIWLLDRSPHEIRMVVAHEEEHVSRRDPQLLLASLFLVVLFPWNVGLVWACRRLRRAVEMDCDQRVLERGFERRAYGRVLLEVGSLGRPVALTGAAALSESSHFLERRVRMLMKTGAKVTRARRLGAALVGGAAVFGAAAIAPPLGAEPADGTTRLSPVPAVSTGGPRVELESVAEAAAAIEHVAGVHPSAPPAITPTPGVEVAAPPVTLQPRDTLPVFTPYDVKPELRDRQAFARLLESRYPPMLRDAGISGTVMLWVNIDDEGNVVRTRITQSSGHTALDEAAQGVIMEARFTPALNQDRRVPVWIQLPITFQARTPPS